MQNFVIVGGPMFSFALTGAAINSTLHNSNFTSFYRECYIPCINISEYTPSELISISLDSSTNVSYSMVLDQFYEYDSNLSAFCQLSFLTDCMYSIENVTHFLWINLMSELRICFDNFLRFAHLLLFQLQKWGDFSYFHWRWISATVSKIALEILKPDYHITSVWLSNGGTNHGTTIRTPARPFVRLPPRRDRVFQPPLAPSCSGSSLIITCNLKASHFLKHTLTSGTYKNPDRKYKNYPGVEYTPPLRRGSHYLGFFLLVLLVALLELFMMLGERAPFLCSPKTEDTKNSLVNRYPSNFNQDISVYMVSQGSESNSDIARTPNSTPKKNKTRSRLDLSSQPLPKTLSPIWTPGEKLARKLRNFSQGSSISPSGSDCSSSGKQAKKKCNQPKGIDKDGAYDLDQKKTCRAHFITSFLDEAEADRLREDLSADVTIGSQVSRVKPCLNLNFKVDNSKAEGEEPALYKQIKFLSERLEKTLLNVFDISSKVSKVVIRKLPNFKDHIPYETCAGKEGPNPVVSFLTLGAPRLLKLRKGSRLTHQAELHSGTLFTLSGRTSLEYSHSIPKGKVDNEYEQITIMFIGSPQEGSLDLESDSASDLCSSESESAISEETEGPSESEYESESIYSNLLNRTDKLVPALTVTNTSDTTLDLPLHLTPSAAEGTTELTNDMERLSDIIEADKLKRGGTLLKVDSVDGHVHPGPHTPEECEKTVIPAPGAHQSTSRGETTNSTAWAQSLVENSIIDLKTQIEKLTCEVKDFNDLTTEKIYSMEQQIKTASFEKQIKKLNDLWERNLTSTSSIKNAIDQVFTDLHISELRAQEVDNHLNRLKYDLKNYYNSAFFREDSKLIKEIHKTVSNKTDATAAAQTSQTNNNSAPQNNFVIHPSRVTNTRQGAPTNDLQSRRSAGFSMTQSRRNVITPTQHANPHQTDNADGRIQPQTDRTSTRVFKTILITDSILRHVKDVENALGVNHNLQVINKRSTWGLKDDEFRAILRREIPDFLYVHLGINDIHQNFDTKQSMENICSLILFMDKYLPDCKVFLSQPLLTGDSDTNHGVRKLRLSIKKFVTGIDTPGRLKDKQILLNENTNFSYNNAPISEYYSSDRIHLSQRGKTAILGNLRHHIHAVTRDILNKPSRLPRESSANTQF